MLSTQDPLLSVLCISSCMCFLVVLGHVIHSDIHQCSLMSRSARLGCLFVVQQPARTCKLYVGSLMDQPVAVQIGGVGCSLRHSWLPWCNSSVVAVISLRCIAGVGPVLLLMVLLGHLSGVCIAWRATCVRLLSIKLAKTICWQCWQCPCHLYGTAPPKYGSALLCSRAYSIQALLSSCHMKSRSTSVATV